MQSTFKPFKPLAVRDGVSAAIREALLQGEFSPGEPISERELAKELKVSQGPVREALLVLTAEGLVTHTQNYGFSWLQLSGEDLAQIDQVRVPLEAMALRLARERVTGDDLKDLANLADQIVEAVRNQNLPAHERADETFHMKISELSGNRWLTHALHRILAPYFAFERLSLKGCAVPLELVREQHDGYLNYLRGGSASSAEECVKFHLNMAEERAGE